MAQFVPGWLSIAVENLVDIGFSQVAVTDYIRHSEILFIQQMRQIVPEGQVKHTFLVGVSYTSSLVVILGAPTTEQWEEHYNYDISDFENVYCLYYEGIYEGVVLRIDLASPDAAADAICIYSL